jgi:hypothetical protein
MSEPTDAPAALEAPTQQAETSVSADRVEPVPAPYAFRRQRPRPVLGPSLVAGGTLLWAFVVFGDLIVNFRFPEALGTLIVLGAFAAVAWQGGRQSIALLPARPETVRWRLAVPGVLGFVLFANTVLFTSVVARTERMRKEGLIIFVLIGLAFAAVMVGRRFSGPSHEPPSWPLRAALLAGTVLGGLATIVVTARALLRF